MPAIPYARGGGGEGRARTGVSAGACSAVCSVLGKRKVGRGISLTATVTVAITDKQWCTYSERDSNSRGLARGAPAVRVAAARHVAWVAYSVGHTVWLGHTWVSERDSETQRLNRKGHSPEQVQSHYWK